jgi:hypothetical protein
MMIVVMPRKNNTRAFCDATLREVKKEMAKPRVVESVRRATTVDPGRREPRKPGTLCAAC